MKTKTNFLLFIMTIFVLTSIISCKDEEWAKHYSLDQSIVSKYSLWQQIQMDSRLDTFALILKKTGYDKKLDASQMYTVWAPINEAIDGSWRSLDSVVLKKRFVENHIARTSFSASGVTDTKIKLIDKKQFYLQPKSGDEFYFGDLTEPSKVLQKNIVANNGLLNIIDKRLIYNQNIWEYIGSTHGLDSLKAYLFSFNKDTLDVKSSIAGDIDSKGNIIYLDSVIINKNIMFNEIGYLNHEDSTYISILPTNTAWNLQYANIKPYFRYFPGKTSSKTYLQTKHVADSLIRTNTCFAIVRDLIFSNKKQNLQMDSIYSTYHDSLTTFTMRDKFYHPIYLVNGATYAKASNGDVYSTDLLQYHYWDSWHKEINIEGEQETGRVVPSTSTVVSNEYYQGKYFSDAISGSSYVKIAPTAPSQKPSVTFDIPNTISGKLNPDKTIASGGAYNIYCVFVPDTIENPSLPKQSKVSFSLYFMNEQGDPITKNSTPNVTYDNSGSGYIISKSRITKILIASNIVFPYCEYGKASGDINVKLKISSMASTSDVANGYTKNVYIDKLIFEPVH